VAPYSEVVMSFGPDVAPDFAAAAVAADELVVAAG
jgi:hypothetical protein